MDRSSYGYGQDRPYSPAPQYPQQPQYPQDPRYAGGQPPTWPTPQYEAPPQAPRYADQAPAYRPAMPPARPQAYQAYDAPAMPTRQRPAEHARRTGMPVGLPHLPIAHVLLIVGIAAMAFAISQSWGTDASGTPIYVRDFANARLARHGVDAGSIAVNAAIAIVVISAILGAGLILLNSVVTLLNRILGIVGLPGCASLVFFPVLWGGATLLFVALLAAAGFAGLGAFSNLPVVQDHGFAVVTVQQHGPGFYLWAGGIIAAFIGMLGQLVLRRR